MAATAATTASISDDWQEVSDDNMSIVSLPTSEEPDESLDDLSSDLYPRPSTPKNKANELRKIEGVPADSPNRAVQYDGEDDAERFNQDLKDVAPPLDDSDDDILDVDMDPTFLVKVDTSLLKLLGEILGAIHFKGSYEPRVDTHKVEEACVALRKHLEGLKPILEGYSKHWNPNQASDLPLDPGLYGWMSEIKIELLGVQALLQRQMGLPCLSNQPAVGSDMEKHSVSLTEFSDWIAGFLPIMQADYDEFHTANLPFPSTSEAVTVEVAVPPTPSHPRFVAVSPPGNHVARLRTEVYSLKDEITNCLRQLEKYRDSSRDEEDQRKLQVLTDSYHQIKASLDLILSNHASEWIDYGLAGGITYPEFIRLNPDTIRSLILQLRETSRSLSVESTRIRSMRFLNDPDKILDYETWSVKDEDASALKSIQEVLQPLFQIRTMDDEMEESVTEEKN